MRKRKIFIADDEADVVQILEKRFKQLGHDVLTASDGSQAIGQCAAFAPDVIILDVVMPGLDGFSAASALRKEKAFADTPIIFMTAQELEYSAVERRLRGLSNCGFITKPCTFEELLAKVKEAL